MYTALVYARRVVVALIVWLDAPLSPRRCAKCGTRTHDDRSRNRFDHDDNDDGGSTTHSPPPSDRCRCGRIFPQTVSVCVSKRDGIRESEKRKIAMGRKNEIRIRTKITHSYYKRIWEKKNLPICVFPLCTKHADSELFAKNLYRKIYVPSYDGKDRKSETKYENYFSTFFVIMLKIYCRIVNGIFFLRKPTVIVVMRKNYLLKKRNLNRNVSCVHELG